MLMRWWRRFVYWLRFRAQQDELREELELHRELLADDLQRRGLEPDAAHSAARRAMGNETLMREDARSVWLTSGAESVLIDTRYAGRGLRRSPAFTTLVSLTVALTIAANTTVYSVIRHVLLQPLSFADGNRIVHLGSVPVADPLVPGFGIPAELLREAQARSRTMQEFAAVSSHRVRIGSGTDQREVRAASVAPALLPMLRLHPLLGREFTSDDARNGAPVAMIGFPMWQQQYAGARDIVGRVVKVNGAPRTIIGVLPNGFDVPMSTNDTPDILLPLDVDTARGTLVGYARLRRGASSADASRELQLLMGAARDTGSWKGMRAAAMTARDWVDPRDQRALELLFATVCGLLIIACANIATLLLMRGWSRQRELAIRLALGAGRLRLARQLLAESVLLALLGGALGLGMARLGLRSLIAIYPSSFGFGSLRLDGVGIDTAVVGWTAALSVGTGLLFGIGPAFLSAAQSLGDALRTGGRTAVGSSSGRRFRNILIVSEIAVSLVFLSGAVVLTRSFVALTHTSVGVDPSGLLTVYLKVAHAPKPRDTPAFEHTLIDALRAVPGVTDAAFGGGLGMSWVIPGPFAVDGPDGPRVLDLPMCETPRVSPEYFRVTRVPLVAGRTFDADPAAASGQLIVNRLLAKRLWPNGNAIGSRVRFGEGKETQWLTVIGVAGDVHLPGTHGDLFNLQMYRPSTSVSELVTTMVVRVNERANALEPALRRAVDGAGVSAELSELTTTESLLERRVFARPRFAVEVFGVFAFIALAVAAAGLYGIIAYAVTQRAREIGVRVALGADASAVARLVLGDSARLVLVGAGLGLFGAYLAMRLLAGFLYEIGPRDPTSLGASVVLLAVVALVATLVPVRRALRIDPMDALRSD